MNWRRGLWEGNGQGSIRWRPGYADGQGRNGRRALECAAGLAAA